MTTTHTTTTEIDTLRAELARLTAKSERCWALVACETAPDHERNAAASRCLDLDYRAGKVAVQLRAAERKAAALRSLVLDAEIYQDAGVLAIARRAQAGDAAALAACEMMLAR